MPVRRLLGDPYDVTPSLDLGLPPLKSHAVAPPPCHAIPQEYAPGVWGVGCGVWGVVCGVWGVVCGSWVVCRVSWGAVCGVWGVVSEDGPAWAEPARIQRGARLTSFTQPSPPFLPPNSHLSTPTPTPHPLTLTPHPPPLTPHPSPLTPHTSQRVGEALFLTHHREDQVRINPNSTPEWKQSLAFTPPGFQLNESQLAVVYAVRTVFHTVTRVLISTCDTPLQRSGDHGLPRGLGSRSRRVGWRHLWRCRRRNGDLHHPSRYAAHSLSRGGQGGETG